jgi:hypothetical protein
MSVFWLIVLAATLGVVTVLWIKEALTVVALTEHLARRDHDIARLDGLLLLCADERGTRAKKAPELEPARQERIYRWVA